MRISVYRIHTDHGTYVGQTKDFNVRMGYHYKCKMSDEASTRPIVHAIRETPDERLHVEEIGLYEVETRRDMGIIERYWINRTKENLNVLERDKGNAVYHTDVIEFVRDARCERGPDDGICTDFRRNYEVLDIIERMWRLRLDDPLDGA